MKRNNSVSSISGSTVATIVLSAVVMTLLSVMLMAGASFANSVEVGDEFSGPGIGMKDSTWDGTKVNRLYGYGDLNNIIGNEIVDHNALSSEGPTNYVEYTEDNPIDHNLIDMGPKSASNAGYSLYFINDGGPGMNVQSNALGNTVYYEDGGPGSMVSALNGTENIYADNGPRSVISTIDPSDYVKLLTMKPGDFTFVGSSKADKLGK